MNEESVNNIIAYMQQYPDVPTEQLVANILQTGYKMDDLKEALRRQSISPIVIPGYVEPDPPPPKPFFSKMPVIIALSVVAIMVIGLSVWAILMPKKQETNQDELSGKMQQAVIPETKNTQIPSSPSATLQPTIPPASSSATMDDIFKSYRDTFNSGDYKVTIDTTAITEATAEFSASRDHKTFTVYTKRGVLVRQEEIDKTLIYKDNKLYTLNTMKKNYIVSAANPITDFNFLPTILITESKNNHIRWEKKTNTEWSGIWNINTNRGTYTIVTVVIDDKTNLLTKLFSKSPSTSSTHEITMSYEKISDTDKFILIPTDYTQATASATP